MYLIHIALQTPVDNANVLLTCEAQSTQHCAILFAKSAITFIVRIHRATSASFVLTPPPLMYRWVKRYFALLLSVRCLGISRRKKWDFTTMVLTGHSSSSSNIVARVWSLNTLPNPWARASDVSVHTAQWLTYKSWQKICTARCLCTYQCAIRWHILATVVPWYFQHLVGKPTTVVHLFATAIAVQLYSLTRGPWLDLAMSRLKTAHNDRKAVLGVRQDRWMDPLWQHRWRDKTGIVVGPTHHHNCAGSNGSSEESVGDKSNNGWHSVWDASGKSHFQSSQKKTVSHVFKLSDYFPANKKT